MSKKMTRIKQLEFLKLWAALKQDGGDDKSAISSMLDDYLDVYGECKESKFCEHCQNELRNWQGGFSSAMEGWFDDDLVLLVNASKKASNVEKSLDRMMKQTEAWQEIQGKIIKSLMGNGLFVLFAVAVFIAMCIYGLPLAYKGVSPEEIGGITGLLMRFGVFTENYGVMVLLFCLGVIGLFWYMAINYVGKNRPVMDKVVPFYSFYLARSGSRFFTLLEVLMTSPDMSLRKALETLDDSGLMNNYTASHIDEMLFRLKERKNKSAKKGGGDFNTLDTGLLPPKMRLRLKNASKSTSDNKSSMIDTISQSLLSDYGERLVSKVEIMAKGSRYFSGFLVVVSLFFFVDGLFTMFEKLQSSF